MDKPSTSTIERIRGLEVSMEGFKVELDDINHSLKSIADRLSKTRETNWPLIFSVIGLLFMLWAAAIRPLNSEVMRQEQAASTLAAAVLKQNESIQQIIKEVTILRAEYNLQVVRLEDVIEHGSPTADRRISILEFQINKK